jgi:hypothetical protein
VPLPAGVSSALERFVMDSATAREASKGWLDERARAGEGR